MAMTITEFAGELIDTLKTTDFFKHASFSVQTVPKPGNVVLTGITIKFHDSNVAPCYYINDTYNQYATFIVYSSASVTIFQSVTPCSSQ